MTAQTAAPGLRRTLSAALALAVAAGGGAVAVAPAGAYPKNKPIKVALDDDVYAPGEIIKATVTRAQPGCKVTVALSGNGEGGSATEKASSAGQVEVDFDAPPAGTNYKITATSKGKNCLQESGSASFDVIKPTVTGPKRVSVGAVATIKATGFPGGVTITWKVTRNGKKVSSGTTTASGKGNSSLKVDASKAGNYSVKATSGKFGDSWAFAAG